MLLLLWLTTRPATTITATFDSIVVVSPHEFFATGIFLLTGKAAALIATRKITATAGSFALSGQAANLKKGYRLNAEAGSFGLTGQAAALRKGFALAAGTGAFTLTGQAAGLRAVRTMTAAAGSFALSGVAAGLYKGRTLTAGTGTFTLTGVAAGVKATRKITASAGSFTLSGQAATLTYAPKVAFDAISSTTATSTNTTTHSHTCTGSNRFLVVNVMSYVSGGVAVSGVTYNGVSMTNAGNQAGPSGNTKITTFTLIAPATGAHNVVVTLAGTADEIAVAATSFVNVNQTTPNGTFVSANGTSTTPSVTATSQTTGMVLDGMVLGFGGNPAPGTGQTQRFDLTSGFITETMGSTEAGAASVVMDWSNLFSQGWAIVALPIKPV